MKDYCKHNFLKDIEVEGHADSFTNAFLNTIVILGVITIIISLI